MSHAEHGGPDFSVRPLPGTGHITFGVKLFVVGAVLASFFQGALVCEMSTFGKIWPAADSTKIALPPMNLETKQQ
jgi:hypothetical protein